MKARFRLLKMNSRGGTFYSVDCETGKRTSFGTAEEYEALQIINAKNESLRQGWLNLQLGRVYLSGTDSGAATRTWQHAMTAIVDSKAPESENRFRWEKAIKEKAFDLIRNKVILETKAEDLQAVLNAVSGGMKVVESWRFEIPFSSLRLLQNLQRDFFFLLPFSSSSGLTCRCKSPSATADKSYAKHL